MRRNTPSIAGITWQRLQQDHAVTYPCRHEGDPGEPAVFSYEHPRPMAGPGVRGETTELGRFHNVERLLFLMSSRAPAAARVPSRPTSSRPTSGPMPNFRWC
jgi:hypothetical protein